MKLRTLSAGAVVVFGAFTLAACTPAVGGTAEVETSTAALTSTQQDCVDAVSADLATATADTELVAPSAPLDLDALSGQTVWFITVTMNQFSTDMATGVQEAADAAGVELVTFDGQGTANRFNEGIEQAVAQGAGGIILVGIDPAVVSSALAKAEAAGIPVQNTLNGDATDEVPAGMHDNLTSDFTADGEIAAKWALVDSGCSADMVLLYSSSVAVWDKMYVGAEGVFEEYCPEDCTFNALNIDLANVSTDIGSQLQTALQQNLDTDYVFPVWDSAVPFVTPVLSAANSDAKVLARDGLEANIELIVAGTDQDMTVGTPPTGWLGWLSFDDIARAMVGEDAPGYVIPTRVIDTENVGDGSVETLFPNYVDFETAFTDAWQG